MPTDNQEVYDAIRKYAAAGDMASVKKLGDYLQSQDSVQPQQSFAETPKQMYDNLSTYDAAMVGAGKAASDIVDAGSQIGLYVASKLAPAGSGMEAAINRRLTESTDKAAADEAQYQKYTPNGYAAGAGRVIGNVAATFVPAGAAAKAVGATGKALSLAQIARGGAAAGAVGGLAQPVMDSQESFGSEKLKQVGIGAVVGAAVPSAIYGVGQAAKLATSPRQTLANYFNNKEAKVNPEFLAESTRLEEKIGQMTPAMRTGSRQATGAENSARQNFWSGDIMKETDKRISDNLGNFIDGVMNRVKTTPENPESAGRSIQSALRSGVKSMFDKRDAEANVNYGKIREMFSGKESAMVPVESKILNASGKPMQTMQAVERDAFQVKPDGLANALRGIIAKHENVAADEAKRISSRAAALLRGITDKNGQLKPLSIQDAMKTRSYYSKAASGTGEIFKDVAKNDNRTFARELWNALEGDFDNVANEAGGTLGDAIKQANSAYRKASLNIEQVEKGVIGKILGKDILKDGMDISQLSPELIASKVSSLQPSQAKVVKGFLQQSSPETIKDVQRYILQQAWEATKQTPVSAGADPLPNFAAFNKTIQSNKALSEWLDKKTLADVMDAQAYIRRMSDKFGYNFSGTSPQSAFEKVLESVTSIKGASQSVGSILGIRGIAKGAASGKGYQLTINPGVGSKLTQAARGPLGTMAAIGSAHAIAKPGTRKPKDGKR